MRYIFAISFFLLVTGCAHYRVTDPSTGKIYYTKQVKYEDGATMLKDEKTGNRVSIQNSEIEQITKPQYEAAVGHE